MQFLGRDVSSYTSLKASNSLSSIDLDKLSENQENTSSIRIELNANIKAPTLIVPIKKNNDPMSPVWVFKMGCVRIQSKEDKTMAAQYISFETELTSINIEVILLNNF